MEYFRSILRTMGFLSDKVDFVADLPPEVSHLILRQLDAESLLNAAKVSRKWEQVCRSDCLLRRKARRHLRQEKRSVLRAHPHYRLPVVAKRSVEQKQRPVFKFVAQAPPPAPQHIFQARKMFGDDVQSRQASRKIPTFQNSFPKPQLSRKGRLRM